MASVPIRTSLVGILAAGVLVAASACAGADGPPANPTLPDPRAYAAEALDVMELSGYAVDAATWPGVRAAAEQAAASAPDAATVHAALRQALTAAGGVHSRLEPPGEIPDDPATPPRMPQVDASPEGVSTVTVPALVTDDDGVRDRYDDLAAAGIRAVAPSTSCGWIVDLRGNDGGDMWPMLAAVSPLLPEGDQLSFVSKDGQRTAVELRDGASLVGGSPQASAADPVRPAARPVAVLQDGDTASSGEAVLLAFRDVGDTRTFGSASAGYSSANATVPLPDGATMYLTTAVFADRTGTTWGGRIQPDQPATDAAADARTWLLRQCR